MSKTNVPMGVKYVGFVASPALEAQVASHTAKLAPFLERVDYVTLQLGRWHLHQNAGTLFRVTLDVDIGEGVHPLTIVHESSVGADASVLEELLDAAVTTAERQLTAVLTTS